MNSYSSNRKKSVCVGNSQSTYLNCNIPQGSILGPILFSLYIGGYIWFAWFYSVCDDTVLYVQAKNKQQPANN